MPFYGLYKAEYQLSYTNLMFRWTALDVSIAITLQDHTKWS